MAEARDWSISSIGMLSGSAVQMMTFLDVQDGDYVNNQKMPKVQVSALGVSLGSEEDSGFLRILNYNPWIVSIKTL